jgi:hypothetical protein
MNSEYIMMCKSAKEIQDLWIPKPGDRLFNPYPSIHHKTRIEILVDIKGSLVKRIMLNEDCSYLGKIEVDIDNIIPLNKRFTWLPRQEDLQNIVIPKIGITLDLILEMFMRYFNEDYEFDSDLNKIWLCFVMQGIYNKKWKTETETWEAP